MPMTDTDHLSTPTDMADLLKDLTTIMRDVETLPDTAQLRFWDDVNHNLQTIPEDELLLGDVISMRSVNVLYSILSTICGPKLAEMVNGATKEYYESIIAQMKEVTHRPWDAFLDQKFDETKGTEHEGCLAVAAVSLHTIDAIGRGLLRYVAGDSKLLRLTTDTGKERYFSSKDIIMMEFDQPSEPF